jgi:hypothetical protein
LEENFDLQLKKQQNISRSQSRWKASILFKKMEHTKHGLIQEEEEDKMMMMMI